MSATKTRPGSRLRKVECQQCGCILYASAGALQAAGLPRCGCGGEFTIPKLVDLLYIDPAAFESAVARLEPRSRTQAMRELGFTGMIERKQPSARKPHCRASGCHKFRARQSFWCTEHTEQQDLPF